MAKTYVGLVHMYFENYKKTGTSLFDDVSFLGGFAFGVFAVMYIGMCVLCFMRMFSCFYGKEIAAHRLLVKRSDEAFKTG